MGDGRRKRYAIGEEKFPISSNPRIHKKLCRKLVLRPKRKGRRFCTVVHCPVKTTFKDRFISALQLAASEQFKQALNMLATSVRDETDTFTGAFFRPAYS